VQKLNNNLNRSRNSVSTTTLLRKSLTTKIVTSKYLKMINLSFNLGFRKYRLHNLAFNRHITHVRKKYWLKPISESVNVMQSRTYMQNRTFYHTLAKLKYQQAIITPKTVCNNFRGKVLTNTLMSNFNVHYSKKFLNLSIKYFGFSKYFLKYKSKFFFQKHHLSQNHYNKLPFVSVKNAVKIYLQQRHSSVISVNELPLYLKQNSFPRNQLFNKFLLYSLVKSSSELSPLYKRFKKNLSKKWQLQQFLDYRKINKKKMKNKKRIEIIKKAHPLRFRSFWLFKSKFFFNKQLKSFKKTQFVNTR
jgi:hypothetical protein